ncbi:MAG: radical SAM protein [Oscillospiraceae bacterium]|nr:radical SAM protein [Oscillospiraceae bacterium]
MRESAFLFQGLPLESKEGETVQMKHANLSIFVPHMGCPQSCSFCNQRNISGAEKPPTSAEVTRLCNTYLPKAEQGSNTEIAFFGGSFTAIDYTFMVALLQAAYPFVQQGRAAGIRISTRPDAIDANILNTLKQYGVTAIELGAQSMDDEVLKANRRGHTVQQVCAAAQAIQAHGFSLGLQMMLGLYGEQDACAYAQKTAQAFLALCPDTVRIYPTLVVAGTQLAEWYTQGQYTPLTIDAAADICAQLIPAFEAADIRVIRVGLHADESLASTVLAGPYHPAFRQIAESRIYLHKMQQGFASRLKGTYTVCVPKGELSTAAGQKKCNLQQLFKQGYTVTVKEDAGLCKKYREIAIL